MVKVYTSLFHILSCVISGAEVDWNLFSDFDIKDWERLYLLSKSQGVVAIVFDKVKGVPKQYAPPRSVSFRWLSHSFSIEEQMKTKESTAIEFAERLYGKGISVAVLKGLAYASYYPNPYQRESGDLDCFMLGKKEQGDREAAQIGATVKPAGYKHSHIYYKGLTIENHNYITSFDSTKLGVKTERLLQGLIADGCRPIDGTKLLNPSADFNAMFLIKHAQRHFIREGICLRHVLDWAFFLQRESESVNWDSVLTMMEQCRILKFAQLLTSICVDRLGMTVRVDGLSGWPNAMSELFVDDILAPQPDLFHENIIQKAGRILRRFCRMWRFRGVADESYCRLVWNSIAFSSYFKREPKL